MHALVVIDVQVGLLDSALYRRETLLEKLKGLLDRARAKGVPIVFVQDDDVGEVGSAAWQVHPDVAPRPGEKTIRKKACDSFHETELDAWLRSIFVTRLVIGGCMTQFCIDTTVRRAITLGYGVTLVRDAHTTKDSDVLPAPSIIAHHAKTLDGFGALVGGKQCVVEVVPASGIEF